MSLGIQFIDTVPDYEIRAGIVYVTINGVAWTAMPLATFREAVGACQQLLDDHDAKRFPRETGVEEQPSTTH